MCVCMLIRTMTSIIPSPFIRELLKLFRETKEKMAIDWIFKCTFFLSAPAGTFIGKMFPICA